MQGSCVEYYEGSEKAEGTIDSQLRMVRGIERQWASNVEVDMLRGGEMEGGKK